MPDSVEPSKLVESSRSVQSVRIALPVPPDSRPRWRVLLGVLVVCAVPLLVDLGVRDSWHTMENVVLCSTQEVFLALHGWYEIPQNDQAWIVPTWRGHPRLNKPPLTVWLNLLAWGDLTPQTSTTRQLTFRARLVSVAVGLVMLGAVFWLGLSVGNVHTAALAALCVGTTLLFQKQARLASYDIHMASFATLAIAGAWWAIAPLRPEAVLRCFSGRWLLGWGVCGLGWAAAIMSKGPLAMVLVLVPVLLAMGLTRRWKINLTGLVLAMIVMLLLAAPWYGYIFSHYAVSHGLWNEYRAARPDPQPVYYYLGLLGLAWPWTVYMISGLIHPFGLARGERRKQLLFAWGFFCLIFIFFSIPQAKQQRYILPILPAVGLMVAALWQDHQRLADQGKQDPGINMVRLPHWIMLAGASLLFSPILLCQSWLAGRGYNVLAKFAPMSIPGLIGWTMMLLILVILGIRAHWRNHSLRAGYLTAAWAIVFTTGILHAYAYGPQRVHPVHDESARVVQVVQGAPIRYLRLNEHHLDLNEEFVFYVRRIIQSINPDELKNYLAQTSDQQPRYILALVVEHADNLLKKAGFRYVLTFDQDYHSDKMPTQLWRYDPHPRN